MLPPRPSDAENYLLEHYNFAKQEFVKFASAKMLPGDAGTGTCAKIDRCKNALAGQERRNCSQWRQLIHSGDIHKMHSSSMECHDTYLRIELRFLEFSIAVNRNEKD